LETPQSRTKSNFISGVVTTIILAICTLNARHAAAQVEYVDPTIGNVGILLVPTRPAVYLPNSMVRVYPMRDDAMDDRIASFPLTISSHRQQELFSIMPGDGRPAVYDQEKATPYYYSTRFDDSLIRTEFSPTERCGYFRFSFPKGEAAVVLGNRQPGSLHVEQNGALSGEETVDGLRAYFYGEFSAPVRVKAESADGKGRLIATGDVSALELR
jgi:putative alpha-1,2-mannosidase